MVEPINLNKARKEREKAAAKAQAAENRVRFGRTKAEKSLQSAQAKKADKSLDETKREP